MCIATVFAPKVESGEQADVPKVEHGEQRVLCNCYSKICHLKGNVRWDPTHSYNYRPKDEHFKLPTALVQEQVYAWVIASSFVMLLDGMQMWLTMQYSILKIGSVYSTCTEIVQKMAKNI